MQLQAMLFLKRISVVDLLNVTELILNLLMSHEFSLTLCMLNLTVMF